MAWPRSGVSLLVLAGSSSSVVLLTCRRTLALVYKVSWSARRLVLNGSGLEGLLLEHSSFEFAERSTFSGKLVHRSRRTPLSRTLQDDLTLRHLRLARADPRQRAAGHNGHAMYFIGDVAELREITFCVSFSEGTLSFS